MGALGIANAFTPQTRTGVALTKSFGYVPNGLSEAEYKKFQESEKKKSAENKKRFPKGKAFLDVADWLKELEKKQTFNGEYFKGSGHTFAKGKDTPKDKK